MRKKYYYSIFILALLILGGLYSHFSAPAQLPLVHNTLRSRGMVPAGIMLSITTDGWHQVLRVIDGDTLEVDINGTDTTIRLLGVNTPETVDPRKPVECFGPQASDEAKKLLTDQTVRLETDPSQGKLDKYGRTLAYVFLPATGEASSTNFDEFMIAQGYGREYTYNKPYKYQKEFKAVQGDAQTSGLGLWSACPN